MARTTTNPVEDLFNNPLLSDVIIHQTYDGITRDYHAHKAILCQQSKWFKSAFTGLLASATSRHLSLREDDPIAFELFLKLVYGHEWPDEQIASTSENGDRDEQHSQNVSDEQESSVDQNGECDLKHVLPIRVYAIAKKYAALHIKPKVCNHMINSSVYNDLGILHLSKIIEKHYSHSVEVNGAMGREICTLVLRYGPRFTKLDVCEEMAQKYPNFWSDMFLQCRSRGQLWSDD